MKKVVVLGSANVDYITDVIQFPNPGETISATEYRVENGGKGANQAVAAARLGLKTTFICCVGSDKEGAGMIDDWRKDNIDVSTVSIIDSINTGVAQICVDSSGENSIVVAPGANMYLSEVIVDKHSAILASSDYLLLQLETPIQSNIYAARAFKKTRGTIVLNPAPAKEVPDELLEFVDIITPNETEATSLTGIKVTDQLSAERAAIVLHNKGIKTVVITLGSKGAFISERDSFSKIISGYKVQAIDTVAAGDTFNGAMLVYLSEGFSVEESVQFAHAAAAIAVSRQGAQRSIPERNEVLDFLVAK